MSMALSSKQIDVLPTNFSSGFAVAFYFSNSSIPIDTCAAELEAIQEAIYPIYAQELVHQTIWTNSDVVRADPSLTSSIQSSNDTIVRRRLLRSQERNLIDCPVPCIPRTQIVISLCKRKCGTGSNTIPGEVDDDTYDYVDNTFHDRVRNLQSSTISFGKLDRHISVFGENVIDSILQFVNTMIHGPCKAIILDLKYTLYSMPQT
jgi:hypothetical protein